MLDGPCCDAGAPKGTCDSIRPTPKWANRWIENPQHGGTEETEDLARSILTSASSFPRLRVESVPKCPMGFTCKSPSDTFIIPPHSNQPPGGNHAQPSWRGQCNRPRSASKPKRNTS